MTPGNAKKLSAFLSTLSLRRATVLRSAYYSPSPNFYPRSPCGERHAPNHSPCSRNRNFYPRSPCGERPNGDVLFCWPLEFLSTLSLRRATLATSTRLSAVIYFYPRSPCGERPMVFTCSLAIALYFYPRSPCGERLTRPLLACITIHISIHALLAESDC